MCLRVDWDIGFFKKLRQLIKNENSLQHWIPACAGMTGLMGRLTVIPAQAGIQFFFVSSWFDQNAKESMLSLW